jgi:arylsulfatase A-like enzyme
MGSPLTRSVSVMGACATVSWLLNGLSWLVESPTYAGPVPWAFGAGTLALWSCLLVAGLAPLSAWLRPRISEARAVRFDRSTWSALPLALLVSVGLARLTSPLLVPLVPQSFSYRYELAAVGAAYLAAALTLGLAWLAARRLGRPIGPTWLSLPLLLAARATAAPHLGEVVGVHGPSYELTLLLLLGAAALPLVRELTAARRAACALPTLLAALGMVVASARLPVERSRFFTTYPHVGGLLVRAGRLFDLDRDGMPAIFGGTDCDDFDDRVASHLPEVVGNGLDDNCRGGDLKAAALEQQPARRTDAPAHSVIIVTLDAARADHATPAHMPRVAELARTAAFFERAYANSNNTVESILSVASGRFPMSFQLGFGGYVGTATTLVEHFRGLGYHTLMVFQPYFAASWWHGERGFAEVDRSLVKLNKGDRGSTSERTTELAIQHLTRLSAGSQPFFVWLHYFDMHEEHLLRPGTPFAGDSPRARYDQEAWSVDRDFGRLVAFLEQSGYFAKDGILVVHGDHGELIDDDGRTGHASWMDEEVLRVPLIVRGPGVSPGRYATRVNLVDVYPTVLGLAAGVQASSFGHDLARVWSGKDVKDRPVFASSYYGGANLGVAIVDRFKLIDDVGMGASYLYDLGADPGETLNLAGSRPALRDELRARLGRIWDLSMNDQVLADRMRQGRGRR